MSAEDNKGYKFRLELTETDFYEDDEHHEHSKNDIKFVVYGDTAKDAVHSLDELREEWYKFIEKWGDRKMKTLDDKKDLT